MTNLINQLHIERTGRILLASLFVLSALKSILFNFSGFVDAVKSKNLPFPIFVAIIALSMKLFGGLSLMFDYYGVVGAYILILFTFLATVLFHNVFIDPSQFNNAMKNIAIIGGLLIFSTLKMK